MSNLKRSCDYREAEKVCNQNEASVPAAPPSAEYRLGDFLPGSELATVNSCGRSQPITTPLDLSQRIGMQLGLRPGDTQGTVALRLNRSAGAINLFLKRNGGRAGYNATPAAAAALSWRSASQRGRCDIAACPPLRDEGHARLRQDWSPEEVVGPLELMHPQLISIHTSCESIHRYVDLVAVRERDRELVSCLRRGQRVRKPCRRGVTATQGKIPVLVLVDQRHAEVESRLIAGHLEGDLIRGEFDRSAVGVLGKLPTRYTMFCRLEQKDGTSVREAFTRGLFEIVFAFHLSLNYDAGKEINQHEPLAPDLRSRFFLPSRQPLGTRDRREPKRSHPPLAAQRYRPFRDLRSIARAYQEMLNERPRKTLSWKSQVQ
jgi:IS30 family transposase